MKKVLILGAGMVAKPMVEYLLERGYAVMVASPMKERADSMIAGHPDGTSLDWSMDEPEVLDTLVRDHDITVSLLPYRYHSFVASYCLKHCRNLVTTSYVQKEIEKMDDEVSAKGLIFLNEAGLDPGIDHMSAMKIIDHIHARGGKVTGFRSLCGALPAPEAADNPFGYKFTWSPKGVILASKNEARYLKNSKTVVIPTEDLFKDRFTLTFPGAGPLEVYPNRDSESYTSIYGIPEVKTMYRGTFRYPGWCETLDAFKSAGMLGDTVIDCRGISYAGFLACLTKLPLADIRKEITRLPGFREGSPGLRSLEFLDMFSSELLNYSETTPFEITSDRMISRMMIGDNERDMVVMQHLFLAEWPDGSKEIIESSLTDYGSPSTNTSIARTVAFPASIAVRLILDGAIPRRGVLRPVFPEIYNPILNELRNLGIEMKETYGLPADKPII